MSLVTCVATVLLLQVSFNCAHALYSLGRLAEAKEQLEIARVQAGGRFVTSQTISDALSAVRVSGVVCGGSGVWGEWREDRGLKK